MGVREFYSASEACGQRCLIQRERDRAREEGEKVEDRERERKCVCVCMRVWSSRLELKRETEVAGWVLGGRERPGGGRRMERFMGAR